MDNSLASKDYSISFARFVAMIFIITCHVQQFYNSELCWWFNVGVQMFFFISGYLYSNGKIHDSVGWVSKQFVKILVPYFICVFITGGIGFVFHAGCSVKQLFHLAVIHGTGGFSTLNHVWFISYILLCYLITPALLRMKVVGENSGKSVIRTGFLLVGLLLFFELFAEYYNPAWIICYTLGIVLGQFELVLSKNAVKLWKVIFVVVAILTNSIKIFCKYIANVEFPGFSRYINYTHVLLGIALVIILMELYRTVLMGKIEKLLDLSDKYSFFIYLTHQVFILGSFFLLAVIANPVIAVVAVLTCSVLSAMILYYSSKVISPSVRRVVNWILVDS